MSDSVYNVLFLCTGNSARSILAERLVEHLGKGKFRGFSAGSFPNGRVNPHAIAVLQDTGISVDGLRSKSWDEFAAPGAPKMDFIFTVCDQAAGEMCPVWTGKPATAHWGVADPAAVEGSDEQKRAAFRAAFRILEHRIRRFVALPFETLDRAGLACALREIGADEGALQP
jgi:arsenate reductase